MTGLNWATRKALYQQAAFQLDNELPLTVVLTDFSQRMVRRGRAKTAAKVMQVERQVRDGRSFTVAMGSGLTPVERSILTAGEQAGSLGNGMRLVLDVQDRTARIVSSFRSTLFAPAVYVVALWIVLWVIGGNVTPQYTTIVPVERWTGWAYIMYLMGQLAVGWVGFAFVGVGAALVVFVVWARARWSGRGRAFCDQNVFPFTLFRDIDGFTWLMTYVALLRAGVTDTSALQMQLSAATPWLGSRLRPVLARLRNGMSLPAAMRATGYSFPSADLIDEIGAYVGFKDFPTKIEGIAREYANTMEKRMGQRAMVISFAFSLLMFLAMAIVQLGANEIQSIMMSSIGSV